MKNTYKLVRVAVTCAEPPTVEWSADFVLEDGSIHCVDEVTRDAEGKEIRRSPHGVVLCTVLPTLADLVTRLAEDHPAAIASAPARTALAAADLHDDAAVMAAVHLDCQRVLAERNAALHAPVVPATPSPVRSLLG